MDNYDKHEIRVTLPNIAFYTYWKTVPKLGWRRMDHFVCNVQDCGGSWLVEYRPITPLEEEAGKCLYIPGTRVKTPNDGIKSIDSIEVITLSDYTVSVVAVFAERLSDNRMSVNLDRLIPA